VGVLVSSGGAGATGTTTTGADGTGGGATDDSGNEIGVGAGTGDSITSNFIGETLWFTDGGGGVSSIWCIFFRRKQYLKEERERRMFRMLVPMVCSALSAGGK
jgi:hypothetical protein